MLPRVDLKRIDATAELPEHITDPQIQAMTHDQGYNKLGESKSDSSTTVWEKNKCCSSNKRKNIEISQTPGK